MKTDRRDKIGRKIGYNWWREHIMDTLNAAESAWQHLRESGDLAFDAAGAGNSCVGYYQLSDAEFKGLHPRPTLKAFLIEQAGMHTEPQ